MQLCVICANSMELGLDFGDDSLFEERRKKKKEDTANNLHNLKIHSPLVNIRVM